MLRLIRNLVRPYRGSLAVVLAAMLVETLASLAAPWPLKVVLDNVVAGKHLPHLLDGFVGSVLGGTGKTQIALLAGIDRTHRDRGRRGIGVLYRQLRQRNSVTPVSNWRWIRWEARANRTGPRSMPSINWTSRW